MDYVIDFGIGNFGVNTLNTLGIRALIDLCGGEKAIIDQIAKAQSNGLLDRRRADACKSKIRTVSGFQFNGEYKRVKVRGVGLVPTNLILKKNDIPYDYRCWAHILERCTNPKGRIARVYKDCKICDEWLEYTKFKEWYNSQIGHNSKYDVDKDLLGDGKLYSPDTCCLLPRSLNSMIVNRVDKNRELPTGVYKNGNAYIARACTGTKDIKSVVLGTYPTPEEAHQAYCDFRSKRIAETAQSYYDKGELDERAYKAIINLKVE